MSKYDLEIPDKLLIDAGGLLNELAKKFGTGGYDKNTTPSGDTFPVLRSDMTMDDLLVHCIEQSIVRFKKILETK